MSMATTSRRIVQWWRPDIPFPPPPLWRAEGISAAALADSWMRSRQHPDQMRSIFGIVRRRARIRQRDAAGIHPVLTAVEGSCFSMRSRKSSVRADENASSILSAPYCFKARLNALTNGGSILNGAAGCFLMCGELPDVSTSTSVKRDERAHARSAIRIVQTPAVVPVRADS